ncbi:MAG: ribosome small subunit-dependent GTPase A [Clostridia bacterium]|nr:ribosome small subunit-dependent GTPase A [Clostridia bacterium]
MKTEQAMNDGEGRMPPEAFQRGTLMLGIGSFYTVKDQEGRLHTLRCRKKFRRMGLSPLTGDELLFSPGEGEGHGWIEEILPRKTVCLRPPVANVTLLVIVLAPEPEPDLLLTDRMISRAAAQEMNVLIAVNKTDLDRGLAAEIAEEYRSSGVRIIPVSARNGTGLDDLREAMNGSLCCLTGQSGAGKSTLLNALMGLHLETGDISRKIARGKNTTRQSELIEKDGLRVMDTAGFNLLETEKSLPPEMLRERYPDFRPYEGKCRFNECLHDREPGCAVQAAADAGMIHRERLRRYRQLLAETRESWRERYD